MNYSTVAIVALIMVSDVKPGSPEMADAIRRYSDCTIRGASELDDGKTDPTTTALRVAAQCEAAYRVWRQAVQGYFFKPEDKIPSNLELSLQSVTVQRSIWQKAGITGRK
jgi:hypothetical protein